MSNRSHIAPFRKLRGIVLPSVLWITVLTIVVAVNYATSVGTSTRAADNIKMAALARYDAIAGVYVGIEHLLAKRAKRSNPDPNLQLAINGNSVEIEIRHEAQKTPINTAGSDELRLRLVEAGLDIGPARVLAARIVDWRDRDHEAQAWGMEDAGYFADGKPYGAKDMPIADLVELGLIMDIDHHVIERLSDHFTLSSLTAGSRYSVTARTRDAQGNQSHVTSAVVHLGTLHDRPYQIIKWRQNG
ncbi:MAG: type II secretion system protein GspK [Gammaproteobacteria bacterium]|nr:type II secretion system protein GspK [Gammaproteobacteria bacterium]MDH3534902.1 type II secretion system protein GspK [Gammaproteobacteria bacterium]